MKSIQKRLRVTDAEICAEAHLSMATLRRVYSDHPKVTRESVDKVKQALEVLRLRRLQSLTFKIAS
jgi:DNA-binding LacI/PurR family transcriptional regulator